MLRRPSRIIHRQMLGRDLWLALLLSGCGTNVLLGRDAPVDGGTSDVPTDVGGPDGGQPDVDSPEVAPPQPCANDDAGLGGVGIAVGTTATASAIDGIHTPDKAIDGLLTTYWSAGQNAGALVLVFPITQATDGVRIAITTALAQNATFTVYGYTNGVTIPLTSLVTPISSGASILPPILFSASALDAMRIEVVSQVAPVGIAEVSVLTDTCP